MMRELTQLLVFSLEQRHYALLLNSVHRVVRSVEVTPLPKAPPIVLGVINAEGNVLPVLNIRGRFLLPEREISPADQFVLAETGPRKVVLVVDEVLGVIESPDTEIIGSDRIVPELEQIRGVLKLDGGLVLIHDLEKFLSLDEARALDEAMTQEAIDGA